MSKYRQPGEGDDDDLETAKGGVPPSGPSMGWPYEMQTPASRGIFSSLKSTLGYKWKAAKRTARRIGSGSAQQQAAAKVPGPGFARLDEEAADTPPAPRNCPEDEAGLLSHLFYTYANGLVKRGYKQALEPHDLWDMCRNDDAGKVSGGFEHHMRSTQVPLVAPKGSLALALWRTHGLTFTGAGVLKVAHDCVMFAQPYILEKLLNHMTAGGGRQLSLILAGAMLLTALVENVSVNIYFQLLYRISLHMKTEMIQLIYDKSLRITSAVRSDMGVGAIVNLQSNDASKIWSMPLYLHIVWNGPMQILIVMGMLVRLMQWAPAMAGLAVTVVMIPLTTLLGRWLATSRKAMMKHTDARVKLITEVITGIKAIKLYAWESPYVERISELREKELVQIRITQGIGMLNSCVFLSGPVLVSLAAFAVHTALGYQLTPSIAFPALALFNLLRFPIIMFPSQIMSLIYARLGLKRIQKFLETDEMTHQEAEGGGTSGGTAAQHHAAHAATAGSAVSIQGGNFTWEVGKDNTLKEINLQVDPGQLVMVVGEVGSGKSSLLGALLGEMHRKTGTVHLGGSAAYTAQDPWIQNTTLRQNVLMGSQYDEDRYVAVLEACALEQDLEQLPAGDASEIGEKGINLSGGQKQRVALARACYSAADVFLLDDPLSAVDAHVGRHLFDECICGLLAGKTRILVTHQLQYLTSADVVVVMGEGRIKHTGTYADLLDSGVDLHNLEGKSDSSSDGSAAAAGAKPAGAKGAGSKAVKATMATATITTDGGKVPAKSRLSQMSTPGLQHSPTMPNALPQLATVANLMDYDEDDDKPLGTSGNGSDSTGIDSLLSAVPGSGGGGNNAGGGAMKPVVELARVGSTMDTGPPSCSSLDGVTASVVARGGGASRFRRQSTYTDSDAEEMDSNDVDDHPRVTELARMESRARLMRSISIAQRSKDGKIVKVEERSKGQVERKVYRTYLGAWGAHFILPVLVVAGCLTERGLQIWQNFVLSDWSLAGTMTTGTGKGHATTYYLYVYFSLGLLSILFQLVRATLTIWGSIAASRSLQRKLLSKVIRLPQSFFDSQPTGRLLNRFTKDVESVDVQVSGSVSSALTCCVSAGFSVLVVLIISPITIVAVIPLALIYYRVQAIYIASSRELKRLDALAFSPIFQHFNESLQGLQTIRAFRKQQLFVDKNRANLNYSNRAYWPIQVVNRWLSVRLELMGAVIVFSAAVFVAVVMPRNAGLAGLALTSALNLTGIMNWMVRQTTELEVNMNSVERMIEYNSQEEEAAAIQPDNRPPKGWPAHGALQVSNLTVTYRVGLAPVLKDVSFAVTSCQKVGVCGRTGCGKSTLMLSLFRIIEPASGRIMLDGIDVAHIGLADLRSRLSLVPQDPVIFSGTIRSNLDPFGEHGGTHKGTDGAIWEALRRAGIEGFVKDLEAGLDSSVKEGGANLSVGQRQLLCMARALLRESRLLVLDEATSNVDVATDALIQRTIRSAFTECTVLTIAHRLHTIIDSDRILVLADGYLDEYDSPLELLRNPMSSFRKLVDETTRNGGMSSDAFVDILAQAAAANATAAAALGSAGGLLPRLSNTGDAGAAGGLLPRLSNTGDAGLDSLAGPLSTKPGAGALETDWLL